MEIQEFREKYDGKHLKLVDYERETMISHIPAEFNEMESSKWPHYRKWGSSEGDYIILNEGDVTICLSKKDENILETSLKKMRRCVEDTMSILYKQGERDSVTFSSMKRMLNIIDDCMSGFKIKEKEE